MTVTKFLLDYFLKKVKKENPYHPYWGGEKFDSDVYQTKKWFQGDTFSHYMLKGNKKYSTDDIFYDINEYGFRINPKELNSNKDIIACFGCSNTFGVGLPWDQTWVHNLNVLLDYKYNVKNYGVIGASTDYMTRMIYNYTLNNKPKIICCLFPEITRMEIIDEETGYIWNFHSALFSHFLDPRYQDDLENWKKSQRKTYDAYQCIYKEKNSLFNFIKNFKFIEMICKLNNIKMYWGTWSTFLNLLPEECIKTYFNNDSFVGVTSNTFDGGDLARDNDHLGEMSNKKIADKFFYKIL